MNILEFIEGAVIGLGTFTAIEVLATVLVLIFN